MKEEEKRKEDEEDKEEETKGRRETKIQLFSLACVSPSPPPFLSLSYILHLSFPPFLSFPPSHGKEHSSKVPCIVQTLPSLHQTIDIHRHYTQQYLEGGRERWKEGWRKKGRESELRSNA